VEAVREYLTDLMAGLKTILLVCGVDRPEKMTTVPKVLGKDLEHWISAAHPLK
jgi:hypothetical protein